MANQKNKPNILMIITDHQAFYNHNRPGTFEIEYPRYKKFISEGVCFNNAYSVCPICTPARASIMTGLYPSKHGIVWNPNQNYFGNLLDFRSGQQLYSHHLSKAGYRNAYIGKWHCGHERIPIDYGIEGWSLPDYGKVYMSDEYHKYAAQKGLGDARAYIEHFSRIPEWEGQILTLHDPSEWAFMGGGCGILQGPPEAHEDNFVAHLTVEKLRELAAANQPWSIVASFWGPHEPYFPSEPYASMINPSSIPEYPSFHDNLEGRPVRYLIHRDYHYPDVKKWNKDWSVWQDILAKCYGQALQNDAAIGSILDALEELWLYNNTIVLWCADHGDGIASHGGLWDKGSTFTEEVARIPMAIRWPDRFKESRKIEKFVSNMDFTATMLKAAGLDVPEDMDGRSLIPLCENKDIDWPDQLICEHNGHYQNILQRIIMYDKYKYVAALYDADELYDLKEDPYEMKNLINSSHYKAVKEELRMRLIRHIEQNNDHRADYLADALKNGF
ncbi:MAG: sulfatase-like hydrolase/transferase [Actinobacteria bacterium]|nr:sulfatase-like hydrolase/transferase [Actinomycetota bacterium]